MVRSLVYYDSPLLRKKCLPIETIDESIQGYIEEMKTSVIAHHGAGMGGPQVGIMLCMIVICFAKEDDAQGAPILKEPEVFINPELIEISNERVALPEGNLSMPGLECVVKRPRSVTMKALNEKGEEVIEKATGWRARVIQHEIDHINGVLFFDHLTIQEQEKIASKLDEIDKTYAYTRDDRK